MSHIEAHVRNIAIFSILTLVTATLLLGLVNLDGSQESS